MRTRKDFIEMKMRRFRIAPDLNHGVKARGAIWAPLFYPFFDRLGMLSFVDVAIVIGFLAVTLIVGLLQKHSSQGANEAQNYLLGGRILTLPAFIATTVSTYYGGILGVGEYTWRYGISNWLVFGVPYYVGALLFALLLSKRARLSGVLTLPERFERHYGAPCAKCAGWLIFLTSLPGAYVLITATLCAWCFQISAWLGIALTAVFIVAYLWRGGFTSLIKTDVIQVFLMFGSFILLTAMLFIQYGIEPLESLPAAHLEPTGGQALSAILVWYVIALSTLTEPNFFQRCFAAKTPEVARNGLLISVVCMAFFDFMTTTCGLYARALLPELSNPVEAFPALGAHVLPPGLAGVFFAGLFATVLSTLDSKIFTAGTTIARDLWPEKIMPRWTITRKTQLGLILAAIAASVIACFAGSVVTIWKVFGSVSAAALLVPILSTYFPKWIRLTPTGAFVLMVASSIVTCVWFASGHIMRQGYWLGLEPLFAGGIVAVVIALVDNIRSRLRFRGSTPSAPPEGGF